MLTRFKEKFGGPQEVVIGIGDWAQRQHMRFKEPVKYKGFRELFRKAGYKIYLVDEFRTSCRCSAYCIEEGICSTFRECDNPKPFREGRILRHGIVKCTTVRLVQGCGTEIHMPRVIFGRWLKMPF